MAASVSSATASTWPLGRRFARRAAENPSPTFETTFRLFLCEDEIEAYIPAHYNDHSTLAKEIVPGKLNEGNFDLQPSKRPAR
jgi:hypothetical protein